MTTTADGRLIDLTRDEKGRRYLATVEGTVIGEAEFLLTPELVVFTHTAIDPTFEGQGVGSVLVRWALDDARAHGYAVLPTCPFVRSFIGRHGQEYGDLVYRSPTADQPRDAGPTANGGLRTPG
jgi:predicted GNAT family acetyltransferase